MRQPVHCFDFPDKNESNESDPLTPLDQRIDESPHPRRAQTAAASRSPRCQYVKPNGATCGSAAMRDQALCYYHHRYQTQPGFQNLPLLDDAHSIQCALHEVMTGLFAARLTPRDAALLLYGLQIASANLRYLQPVPRSRLQAEVPANDFASPLPFAGRFHPEPDDERLVHSFLHNMNKYPLHIVKDHFPVAGRALETAAAAPPAAAAPDSSTIDTSSDVQEDPDRQSR